MKHLKWLLVAALALPLVADGQVYNYFPPPGITYTQAGGMALGSATGGVEGAGTINAQGLYINGTAASTAVGANPSGTVGLSTVNGSATTFMRSDAAPALSQAIAPTMTGDWTFTPSSGTAVTVNGVNGGTAMQINGGTAAFSNGLSIKAGVGASSAINILSAAGASLFSVSGSGAFAIYQGTSLPVFTGTSLGNLEIFSPFSGASLTVDKDIVVGTPTGGSEGAGAVNAQALYVNGTAVSTAVGANPSGTVGLSNVNGSAATFMRSDAAPALSQSISPTWTGNHVFTPSANVALTVNAPSGKTGIQINGGSNAYSITVQAPAVTSNSYGALIFAGTNSTDYAFNIFNQSGATGYFGVRGDGGVTVGTPTVGDEGLGTLNAQGIYVNGSAVATVQSGTWTPTFTGFVASPTMGFSWSLTGDIVHVTCYTGSAGTSNATTMTITNVPIAIQPTYSQYMWVDGLEDNGGAALNGEVLVSGSTFSFFLSETNLTTNRVEAGPFTASGTKGISNALAFSYSLSH